MFSHNSSRVRILLAYAPSDWIEVDGLRDPVPSSMSLSDIVIARECRDERPLANYDAIHPLWTTVSTLEDLGIFSQEYSGHRFRSLANGETDQIPLPRGLLPLYPKTSASRVIAIGDDDSNESDNMIYSRVFPGGVKVETVKQFDAGDEVLVRLSWAPDVTTAPAADCNGSRLIFAAQYSFSALDKVIEIDGQPARLAPPMLLDFFVDKFVQ